MATYAVGDLQGCLEPLKCLLRQVAFDPAVDRLWLVGDLVNRGPQSLETLRFLYGMRESLVCVLGNHDLHLLAVAYGIRAEHKSDTLAEILDAPDRDELIDWVRRRPLAISVHAAGREHVLVHAGLLPQWNAQQALALAGEVQAMLRGPDHAFAEFLAQMYGNEPAQWSDQLTGADRLRCIINAMTRRRFCDAAGVMDFKMKESGKADPSSGLMPWFEVPGRQSANATVVFGHWSALGLTVRPDLIGLDSGCVWGGQLSAMCLEDRSLLQVQCPQFQEPAKKKA